MKANSNNKDLSEITHKTYDQVAKDFSQSRNKKDEIIELFFKCHRPQGKILDLGCGSGRDIRCLNEQKFFSKPKNQYLGLDYSQELLKIAKANANKTLGDQEITQVKFIKQDFQNLNLKEKFDYVLALASLHHIEPKNHLQTLQKIHKTLKSQGEFSGYVWTPSKTQIPKWTKIDKQQYLKPWNGHSGPKMFIYLFKKTELENLLKSAKFKNIKVEIVGQKIKKNLFFKAVK